MPNAHLVRGRAYAALAASGVLFGTGFVFGKLAFAELSVSHTVLYRFVFGGLGLLPIMWRREGRTALRASVSHLPTFVTAAVVGVPVQFLVQYGGLARTTVSHASLMIGTLPVLLAAAAAIFRQERVSALGWAALVVSTIGAALIALSASRAGVAHGPTLRGDLLVVASMFAAITWVLLSKRLMHVRGGQSSAGISAVVILAGTLVLVPWVWLTAGPPPVHLRPGTWAAVISQGLLCTTAATLLWNYGLARVDASIAGVFVNIEPVTGALLGVALFHELLGLGAVAGGLLVIGGTLVVSLGHAARPVGATTSDAAPDDARHRVA